MVSFTSSSSILPGIAETHRDFRFLNTLQANVLPPTLALQRVFLLQSKSPLVRCLTRMCTNPPACSSMQMPKLAHKDEADEHCPPLHSSLCTYLCHGSFRLAFSLINLEMCCITLPSICTPELDCSKAKQALLSHHLPGHHNCLQLLLILPSPVPQGRDSPEFSLSAGQQMTCSVLPLVQYSVQYLVGEEGHRLFHAV